jgi:hypothetical protein
VSKANAKAPDNQASQAPAQASNATVDTGAAPVVQPAQATPRTPDGFHGQGGLYTLKNGRRVLVAQTQPETTKERT